MELKREHRFGRDHEVLVTGRCRNRCATATTNQSADCKPRASAGEPTNQTAPASTDPCPSERPLTLTFALRFRYRRDYGIDSAVKGDRIQLQANPVAPTKPACLFHTHHAKRYRRSTGNQ